MLGNSIASCTVFPRPDTEGELLDLIRSIVEETGGEEARAVVEEVGGYIGEDQPASRAFTFGRGYGYILGVLGALNVRVELIKPQAWQKALGLGTSGRTRASRGASEAERKAVRDFNAGAKRDWKNKLKEKAQQLFPTIPVTLKTCDALLLLEYGRRTGG
jgi:hypothetical protein